MNRHSEARAGSPIAELSAWFSEVEEFAPRSRSDVNFIAVVVKSGSLAQLELARK